MSIIFIDIDEKFQVVLIRMNKLLYVLRSM